LVFSNYRLLRFSIGFCKNWAKLNRSELYPKHGIYKAKGVPTKIVKKEFHYERYNKALFDPKHKDTVTFRAIRSDKHSINVVVMTKVGLSLMDDKKWIASDNITMYAHSNYRIPQLESDQ
jgi:hypothetical protein